MAVQALDVDPAIPAGPEDLGEAASVVAVGLVAHRGQSDADLPGLQANDFEPGGLQPVGQVLRQRAGLEADRLHVTAEAAQSIDDGIDLGRNLRLQADLALVVHDADRDRPQRHVDSGVVGHFHLLLDRSSSLWRARRATSPPDHRCSWPIQLKNSVRALERETLRKPTSQIDPGSAIATSPRVESPLRSGPDASPRSFSTESAISSPPRRRPSWARATRLARAGHLSDESSGRSSTGCLRLMRLSVLTC